MSFERRINRRARGTASGSRTGLMLQECLPRALDAAHAKIRDGVPLSGIAAFMMEEEGGRRVAMLVDTCEAVLSELRNVVPPPQSTIRGFDEPAREGQLRVVTMSQSEGWASHWVLVTPLGKGGQA